MSYFESGVKGYIKVEATVKMAFPIDLRGNAHTCCDMCWYYRRSSKKCGLTDLPVLFEDRTEDSCPLEPVKEEKDETVSTIEAG